MSRTLFTTTGLALGAVLLVVVNLLADSLGGRARLDLTENRLYTLSAGSRRIMASLDEPVTLHLYYSEKQAVDFPQLRSYAERVRGLLEEFTAASGGKLRLDVVDPEPFSEAEDAAVEAGVRGVPVNEAGDVLYFGLVATGSTDQREVVEFLDPRREDSLEYDVSRLVWKLGRTAAKPVLALVSALPLEGAQAMPWAGRPQATPPWFVLEQLRDEYDVRLVPPTATALPEGTSLLCLAHPRGISTSLLYAVDQYVLKGGHALVFVDPFCEADQPETDPSDPMGRFGADRSSSVDPLLAAWGVAMPQGELVGDRGSALRVQGGSPTRPEMMDYIVYLGLEKERLGQDFVTADLQLVRAGTVGHLDRLPGATTEFTPLLTSTTDAMIVPVDSVRFMPDPRRLLSEFSATGTSYVLAARLHGAAKTAFPDGRPAAPPPAADEDGAQPPPAAVEPDPGFVAESAEPINVIVVADADLLADQWWLQRQNFFGQSVAMVTASNGDFVSGALANLAGSNDLIGVRRRAAFDRPFERILAMQREADQAFAAREAALQQDLHETERKLSELQTKKEDGSSLVLSPEQRAEIDSFRGKMLETRKQLRDVQHDLRKDIEGLQTRLKLANIALVPLLLVLAAIGTAAWRRGRREA